MGINNRPVLLNTLAVLLSFGLNITINFFVSPYIIRTLGSDALGFLKLANDFTMYATLITIALNSMATRFLMLAREQGDMKRFNEYFTTLVYSNRIVALVLLLVFAACICWIDCLVNVPDRLLGQVRIAYAMTFIMFCATLSFSPYGICFFLVNRLHIGTLRGSLCNCIAQGCVLLLFYCFEPNISYMCVGGMVSGMYVIYTNLYFFRKWFPDEIVSRSYFSYRRLWELISSGMWNSITKLSQVFSSGLDLLVSNIFISSVAMGYLSVAKMIPGLMVSLNASVAASFAPNLMQHYARGDIANLKTAAKTAIKFMCLFITLPNAVLIVFGEEFFRLWVPDQPAELINILSILTLVNSCVTGPMQPLYQIFTITNKIRQSSIVIITYGFVSILVTLICLKYTSLGLYAVAGVSLVGSLIVALGYHLPYSAKYIGLPWFEFFPEIGKSALSLLVVCLVGIAVKYTLPAADSWWIWFLSVGLMCVVGFCFNVCIVLKSDERRALFTILTKKLRIVKR